MGNDFTELEQQRVRIAAPGALSQNRWPDTMPEFREAFYAYCENFAHENEVATLTEPRQ